MKQFVEMFYEGVEEINAMGNYVAEIIGNVLFVVVCSPIWFVGGIKRLLTKRPPDALRSGYVRNIRPPKYAPGEKRGKNARR